MLVRPATENAANSRVGSGGPRRGGGGTATLLAVVHPVAFVLVAKPVERARAVAQAAPPAAPVAHASDVLAHAPPRLLPAFPVACREQTPIA